MNPHKMRTIIDYIRSQGGLPTDQFGGVLDADDLLVWFGLNELLSLDEKRLVKAEFWAMTEAQLLAEQLRLRS